jgi:hypothetical protein
VGHPPGYDAYQGYQLGAAIGLWGQPKPISASAAGDSSSMGGRGCKGGDPCKGIRDQLKAHQERLQQYASDPYANDNKRILGQGYDDSIIAGRVRGLVHDILLYQKQLEECERIHGLQ